MSRPPPTARLQLLNGFTLITDRPIKLPLASQRVLSFLALHGSARRCVVAGTLWDTDDVKAAACLRTALWRLGDEARRFVVADGAEVALSAAVRVDIAEVACEAHQLFEGHRPSDAAQLIARFEADLLPDWYDEWVLAWREHWRQLRLHALEALARMFSTEGSHGAAVEAALAAVQSDPLRESGHRVLIEAYLHEGNRAEALREFSTYERLLMSELGLGPSQEMSSLVRSARP